MNNKITFNDQDIAVFNFLKEKGITFETAYAGVNSDPKWQADLFIVFFERKGKVYRTEFKTGTGHRVGRGAGRLSNKDVIELAKVSARAVVVNQKDWTRDDYNRKENINGCYRVFTPLPCAASVLYCLLSDMDLASESHAEFCACLGYDEDSRKGLDFYLECQKVGAELLKIFTGEELEAIREMLEDY